MLSDPVGSETGGGLLLSADATEMDPCDGKLLSLLISARGDSLLRFGRLGRGCRNVYSSSSAERFGAIFG